MLEYANYVINQKNKTQKIAKKEPPLHEVGGCGLGSVSVLGDG